MKRRDLLMGLTGVALGPTALADRASAEAEASRRVSLKLEDGDPRVLIGQRDFLRYRRRPVPPPAGLPPIQERNGYIHPVHAPCGAMVTDDYCPDHPHQRGVFSAWTKTEVTINGRRLTPDFWNLHLGTGRVRAEEVTLGDAGFSARHLSEARVGDEWVPVLREVFDVRFPSTITADPSSPGAHVYFDVRCEQTPLVEVRLPEYHYGGFAVRGAREWTKDSDVRVLTSEGKGRPTADASRPAWIAMSGTVAGKPAGIAVIEHPGNGRAPNPVRMHPDMPYFAFAPPRSGALLLAAGVAVTYRYRVVAFNGQTSPERLDLLLAELKKA